MRTLLALSISFATVIITASGQVAPISGTAPSSSVSDDLANTPDPAARAMLGCYIGAFGEKKVTVCLDKIVGGSVTGYSVVGGNERAFSGWYKPANAGGFELQVKEPGDDPTDGVFNLHCEDQTLIGSWIPNNKKRVAVQLKLDKHDFKYDPHAGKYPQSSLGLLKTADVSNMLAAELRVMRNEMYARHGYSFKLKDMQQYFDQQAWYMPVSTDVTGQLTKVEQKNETLIKRYEGYGGAHYDVFGR